MGPYRELYYFPRVTRLRKSPKRKHGIPSKREKNPQKQSHKANGAFSKYKKVKLDIQTKCFPRNAQCGSHFLTQKPITLSIFSGSSSSFNPIAYSFSMTHKDWPTISHGFICMQSHFILNNNIYIFMYFFFHIL